MYTFYIYFNTLLLNCGIIYAHYIIPFLLMAYLRLVFTSNGVIVRVVIRNVIGSGENQPEWIRSRTAIQLKTLSLAISWKLDCWNRKQKQKQKKKPRPEISWFFGFCLGLWQSSLHWVIHVSNEVVIDIGRNRTVLIFPTLIPLSSWLHLWLWF